MAGMDFFGDVSSGVLFFDFPGEYRELQDNLYYKVYCADSYAVNVLSGECKAFHSDDCVSVVSEDCFVLDTVASYKSRQWFELWAKNYSSGELLKIARVRSAGLLHIVLERLKSVYQYIEIR